MTLGIAVNIRMEMGIDINVGTDERILVSHDRL